MPVSAKKVMARDLAGSLDSARMKQDEAAMDLIREEVQANGLVWQVNQLTAKLILQHVKEHTKLLRNATKNKDISEINRLIASSNDILSLNALALKAMSSGSKEAPGEIVY
jgi:lactam utilization protein B